jgi:hypothetical protein
MTGLAQQLLEGKPWDPYDPEYGTDGKIVNRPLPAGVADEGELLEKAIEGVISSVEAHVRKGIGSSELYPDTAKNALRQKVDAALESFASIMRGS